MCRVLGILQCQRAYYRQHKQHKQPYPESLGLGPGREYGGTRSIWSVTEPRKNCVLVGVRCVCADQAHKIGFQDGYMEVQYGIGMVAKCLTVCSSGVLVGIGLPARCSCCGVSRWCLRFAASSWSTALWLRHPPATAERGCYCRARSCALLLQSEVVVVPSWSVQILFSHLTRRLALR